MLARSVCERERESDSRVPTRVQIYLFFSLFVEFDKKKTENKTSNIIIAIIEIFNRFPSTKGCHQNDNSNNNNKVHKTETADDADDDDDDRPPIGKHLKKKI